MKIKTRKDRESEYELLYSNISNDAYTRVSEYLGKSFTPELLKAAQDRIENVKKNIEYHTLNFTFYEVPIQTNRPRVNYHTRNIHVPNARANSDAIEKLVLGIRDDMELIATPSRVIMTAYYPMPKGAKPLDVLMYETCHGYAIGKPDFDNVLKAYCDMIKNHIILDDDLVSSSRFDKYFSLKPRVDLSITYTNGYASEYTYKKIKSRKTFEEQSDRIKAKLLVQPFKQKRGGKNDI